MTASAAAGLSPARVLLASMGLGVMVVLTVLGPLASWTIVATEDFWLFVITPPALIVLASLLLARGTSRSATAAVPKPLVVGTIALHAGGVISLLESGSVNDSAGLLLLGLVTPTVLFVCLRGAAIPPAALLWGFLSAATGMFVWSIVRHGLDAPVSSVLGTDPSVSAGFALVVLTLGCWLLSDRGSSTAGRSAALVVAAVSLATLLILSVAVTIVLALVVLAASVARSPLGRAGRAALGAGVLAGAAVIGLSGLGGASGWSTGDALDALAGAPLTGVGLGQFAPGVPPDTGSGALAKVAAELGVVGLIGALLFIYGTVRVSLVPGGTPAVRAAGAGGVSAVAGFLVATGGFSAGFVPIMSMTVALLLALALMPARATDGDLRVAAPAALKEVRGEYRRRRPYPWMGWYGALLATLLVTYLHLTLDAEIPLLSSRAADLEAVFRARGQGIGPLVGQLPDGLFPAGTNDNPGLSLLVPWLGDLLGADSWAPAFRSFYIGTLGLSIAVLPSLAARLFRSVAAGVIVPLVAIWAFRFVSIADIYFLLAVSTGVGLPALLLVDRGWRRSRPVPPAGLIAVMLFASTMGMLRTGTGTPLLVVAVLIVWTRTSRRHRLPALAVTLLAYFVVSHGMVRIAQAQRTANMGHTPIAASVVPEYGARYFDEEIASRRVPWHLIYIGLGYEPNPYGIVYLDEHAIRFALTLDPKANFPTPRYNAVLRERVFELFSNDPRFVLRATGHKALLVVYDGVSKFPLALLTIAGVLLFAARRSEARRWVAFLLVAGLSAAIYPTLVVPELRYEVGFFSIAAWMMLLGVGWAATALLGERGRLLSLQARGSLRSTTWPGRAAAILGVIVVFAGLMYASRGVRQTRSALPLGSPTAYADPTVQPPLHFWRMGSPLPAGWTLAQGAIEDVASPLTVNTASSVGIYQLVGPRVDLEPGTYVVSVRGRFPVGGIQVGLLDVAQEQWIGVTNYRSQDTAGDYVSLSREVAVGTPLKARVILSNFSQPPASSHWLIDDVAIRPSTHAEAVRLLQSASR